MSRLLLIEASSRGESSISRNLGALFLEKWKATHPESEVVHRDLVETELPYLSPLWIAASLTPAEQLTSDMKVVLRHSDALVAELLSADHIAISTPVYNYNVPANLKSYIDHIVRKGLTLGFKGEGLVSGKKCTVLLASGGVYTDGSPIRDRDIATHYVGLILRVIGIEDVTFVAAGGSKVVDLGETTRDDFLSGLVPAIEAACRA